jgi:glutathione S-transferase
MTRRVYELAGQDDRRFSPFCWRTRMALAHKGLEAEFIPCTFTQKDKIAFSGHDLYPVLTDGDVTVTDSWTIACYLEDRYGAGKPLFGGDMARSTTYFINSWAEAQLHPAIARTIIYDVFKHIDPADIEYFRKNREARFNRTLEEMGAEQAQHGRTLQQVLAPVRNVLAGQRWICGEASAYGDYIIFGALQWARCISPFPIVRAGDPVHEWRNRMIALYDNYADSVPHYDY